MGKKTKLFFLIVIILLLILFFLKGKQPTTVATGNYDFSLQHEGVKRTYQIHIPPTYTGKVPFPLVISLHGGFGNAKAARMQNEWDKKADQEDVLVIYPEAVIGPKEEATKKNYRHWNAGPRTDKNKAPEVDDVGFIATVIEEVTNKYSVDKKRIYATGMSNGGMMVYRLACELSDTFAAVAPIGGNQLAIPCTPTKPISLIHFHGTADKAVPYEGGTSEQTKDNWQPIETTIRSWAQINGCDLTPTITFQKNLATCNTHTSCTNNVEVTLCTIRNGGHTWPGGTYNGAEACYKAPNGITCTVYKKIVGTISQDISATDTMWSFFQQHPMQ